MTKYSNHAEGRCQQRGITQEAVDLLILMGIDIKSDNEACQISLDYRDRKKIIKTLNRLKKIFEKPIYTVVSHDGVVITAAYKR